METQTTWENNWDKEKISRLREDIVHGYLNYEADGGDCEETLNQQKLSGNTSKAIKTKI